MFWCLNLSGPPKGQPFAKIVMKCLINGLNAITVKGTSSTNFTNWSLMTSMMVELNLLGGLLLQLIIAPEGMS